jgi:hypothetical protein
MMDKFGHFVMDIIDISQVKPSLAVSFIWAIICVILYQLGIHLSELIPRFQSLDQKTRREWHNRFVSILHATVISSSAIYYWVYINPSQLIPEKMSASQCLLVDVMMGYLWYDLIFEVMNGGSFDIVGHHFIGLISHYSTRLSTNGAAGITTMMVFVAETSTPFLHTSWLLHRLNYRDTLVFQLLAAALLLTFFFCRYILGPYMLYHMFTHRSAWGDDRREVNLFYWMNVVIVAVFAALNVYWFHKLVAVAMPKKKKGE